MTRAVLSVFAQDYPGDIEVLVVFDAAEPFDVMVPATKHRSVRSMRNERKRGLAGGRNTGILAASNELVGFLDDDDEWRADKITRQVELLLANPTAPLVGAGMEVISPDNSVARPIAWPIVELDYLIEDRIPELNACGILARRTRLLTDLGMVDENIPGSYGEDYDLLIRAARIEPIAVVQDPVVLVYWHGGSYFGSRWWMIIDALQYLLIKHPEFHDNPTGFARIAGQIAFAYAGLGRRKDARRWARKALRRNPREPRAVLAMLVATGAVSSDRVLAELHKRGRGI